VVLILGSTGYIGNKICQYLKYQNIPFKTFTFRSNQNSIQYFDYFCQKNKITSIINCSAYTGEKSIDDCEMNILKTWEANVYSVEKLVNVCQKYKITLVHISTGCIFDGDKNYTEEDIPFFEKSVYSKTKIEAEKIVNSYFNTYICRLRLPFDYIDHPKNLLSKMIKFNKVGDQQNSITNLNDFVLIVVELLQQKFPFGIYNIVNPGSISMNEIKEILFNEFQMGQPSWEVLKETDDIFKNKANTTMSSIKIYESGFILDEVRNSIRKCLTNWNNEENIFW
jgi:dTDP-4-dehydrorhamnose reductase